MNSLLTSFVEQDDLPALSVCLVTPERISRLFHAGRQQPGDEMGTLRDDALFLVASLTKPMVAATVLQLVEQGAFSLNERVVDLLPEFRGEGKHRITIRHLLTHASGLPDQLPDNESLREQHAPFERFHAGVCDVDLSFTPGTNVRYQSMGFVLLRKIVEKVAGQPLRTWMSSALFDPLEMRDSYLGIDTSDSSLKARIVGIRLSEPAFSAAGNWNSDYWRGFGAPWGGLIARPEDVAKFCQMFLKQGAACDGAPLLSRNSAEAAVLNQVMPYRDLGEQDRRFRPWGFGWQHNWLAHPQCFGDLLGSHVVGHWGATGCLMWIDMQRKLGLVICTSEPSDVSRSLIVRISNAVLAGMEA